MIGRQTDTDGRRRRPARQREQIRAPSSRQTRAHAAAVAPQCPGQCHRPIPTTRPDRRRREVRKCHATTKTTAAAAVDFRQGQGQNRAAAAGLPRPGPGGCVRASTSVGVYACACVGSLSLSLSSYVLCLAAPSLAFFSFAPRSFVCPLFALAPSLPEPRRGAPFSTFGAPQVASWHSNEKKATPALVPSILKEYTKLAPRTIANGRRPKIWDRARTLTKKKRKGTRDRPWALCAGRQSPLWLCRLFF